MTNDPRSGNAFEQDKPGTAERDRVEAAIEQLRQRGGIFVEAVRATRMAMALTDPSLPGNPIVFANQSFLNLSGYSMAEVLGQQPYFMNGPDTDPEDAERFRCILEGDQDGVVETVQYAKDGRRFVATMLLSAFKDEAGNTLHHFLSWADVTRRVEAEDDAAELREAQDALRESEIKYRTLFDSIDEGFCVIEVLFDAAGRPIDYIFLETNAAFERQTGLSEAVGKRMRELAPDHEQHWFDIYGRITTTGEPQRFEHPAEALGHWYDVYAFRVGDPEQRHVAILFNDVAERKQAERALRESEARFRAYVTASEDVIYRMSPDWSEMRQLQGQQFLASTEQPSRSWMDRYIDPDDRETVIAAIENAIRTKSVFELEHRVRRADGDLAWTSSRAVPILDEQGEIIEWMGAARDVTARRQGDEALRESEERFRLIVENARYAAIFTMDTEGIVSDWHEGAAKAFGYSAEEIIGKDGRILFTAADRAAHEPEKEFETAAATGKADNVRWHVRKDGSLVFIDGVSTALRDAEGRLTGFLKVGLNATERERAERHQRTLLAELQHRVRNTLAVIRSIVRRTAATSASVEEMEQHLDGRLGAFARTQTYVTRDPEGSIDLELIVRDELLAHASDDSQHISIEGPPVRLSAKRAETISLAVHELATNAVKHGALANSGNEIQVVWSIEGEAGDRKLNFSWVEKLRDRTLEMPQRNGFGTELLDRIVRYELDAEPELEFEPTGFNYRVVMPLPATGSSH